jgi:hypothetical protein
MKLEKIEKKTSPKGTNYNQLTIDGKKYNWFGEIDFSEGNEVECKFKTEGEYTNLTAIQKVENKPVSAQNSSGPSVSLVRTENADSIEIGTPGKGGVVKVYGDFNDLEEFRHKLENAKTLRQFANDCLFPIELH